MMVKQIHIVKQSSGNWGGRQNNASRLSFTGAPTQQAAIKMAGRIAVNQGGMEVVIHRGDNGRIKDSNTIGKSDPFPPRG